MILDYRIYPGSLRQNSQLVNQSDLDTSDFISNLEDMKMYLQLDGAGLAAPQIDWHVRLFLAANPGNEPTVFINPIIISKSKDEVKQPEGCLSFPGLSLNISRPKTVEFSFRDMHWQEHSLKVEGFMARLVCHEVDHLDGILFPDRATSAEKLKYLKWIKK